MQTALFSLSTKHEISSQKALKRKGTTLRVGVARTMAPSHEAEAHCLFLLAFLHGPTDGEDAPDDETSADDAVCDEEQFLPDREFIA